MKTCVYIALGSLAGALAGCGATPQNSATGSNVVDVIASANTTTPPASANTPERAEPSRAPITVGQQTLVAPTDFQMAVLFYQVVGLAPPFDQWARNDNRVRSSNEFDRAAMASRVQEELLLTAQSVAGVGFVEINTRSNFGEYDMAAQGFRLAAIDPERSWSWGHESNAYKLTMENGNEAQLWKIPADQARALVEGGGGRNTDLKLRIKIVGALPDGRGGGTLQGKVVGYKVLNREAREIGDMSFN